MKALAIIRDEHRSIAAVLEGLDYVVKEIGTGAMAPDFELLGAMLHYIEAFPERLHHPKEDEFLFPAVRRCRPDLAPVLDDLEREHVAGRAAAEALAGALDEFRKAGAAGQPAFAATLKQFLDFHWKHMNAEEQHVLPAAEQSLTSQDWAPIDDAFGSNQDPLVGVEVTREMRELFRRIVNLAPPPIGVGPAAQRRN
jgi:branched-chain amino acid transport system ATP-binding protein